jgi:hypothetical protein
VLERGRQDLQPATLSLLASGAVHALRHLGRNQEALGLCERLVPYHEGLDAADANLDTLRLARAELLRDLGLPEEAGMAC